MQSANAAKAAGKDDRRVQQLRQLLLSQLDLIQKQSEVIVAKDHQLKELKIENESLQIKVEKVGDLLTSPTVKTSTVTQEKTKKIKTTVKVESIEEETPDHAEEMETEEPYYTLQMRRFLKKSLTMSKKSSRKNQKFLAGG